MKRLASVLCGILCLWALLPTNSFAAPAPPTALLHSTSHVKAGKVFFRSPTYLRTHHVTGNTGPSNVVYYDGPVMPDVNVYLIFWGAGFSSTYKQIVTNYFNDVGNTSFHNILNQYYDTSTHIHNSVTLAGTWDDTSNPTSGDTCTDGNGTAQPATTDGEIQTEVSTAISTNHWPTDSANGLYFVYMPPNSWINGELTTGGCSYTSFCGYHSYAGSPFTGVAYAAIPFPTAPAGENVGSCYEPGAGQTFPNGDTDGDAAVNISSHEQFEAQSDQFPGGPGNVPYTGWVDSSGNEIADKCAWNFSWGTITLNNGGKFSIQSEWSNAQGACFPGFITPAFWPDTGGVFRPSNGNLYLKLANTTGYADMAFDYGLPGDKPVVGDWTGKGYKTLGIYRNGTFYLRNSNTTGNADIVVPFGTTGDIPVAGDWTGKGYDSIGVYRPSNSTFYLRNSNTPGNADIVATLGISGDLPIVGDWTAAVRIDTIGVFRPSNGIVYLRNSNTTGPGDINFVYGIAGDKPVVGDWNGQGEDTIGVDRNGTFLLRDSNDTGPANIIYSLGTSTDLPIAGVWIAP